MCFVVLLVNLIFCEANDDNDDLPAVQGLRPLKSVTLHKGNFTVATEILPSRPEMRCDNCERVRIGHEHQPDEIRCAPVGSDHPADWTCIALGLSENFTLGQTFVSADIREAEGEVPVAVTGTFALLYTLHAVKSPGASGTKPSIRHSDSDLVILFFEDLFLCIAEFYHMSFMFSATLACLWFYPILYRRTATTAEIEAIARMASDGLCWMGIGFVVGVAVVTAVRTELNRPDQPRARGTQESPPVYPAKNRQKNGRNRPRKRGRREASLV